MTPINVNPSTLSDAALLSMTRIAAGNERAATARLVALLAEVDTRRLYLGEGYSSMFAWCMRALRMSEHAAYARIEAARTARRFPGILERLADGRLSLTTVGLLAPHLTDENSELMIDTAHFMSKRDVERLVAAVYPQPDMPAGIRALPDKTPMVTAALDLTLAGSVQPSAPVTTAARTTSGVKAPAPTVMSVAVPRPTVAPLAPRRYLLRVTIGEDTQGKLERARSLLRHEIPDGDLAAIIERALALLVAHAERTKFAATRSRSGDHETAATAASTSPSSWPAGLGRAMRRSRRIPAAIRRAGRAITAAARSPVMSGPS